MDSVAGIKRVREEEAPLAPLPAPSLRNDDGTTEDDGEDMLEESGDEEVSTTDAEAAAILQRSGASAGTHLYRCTHPVCRAWFSTRMGRGRHSRSHHPQVLNKYECSCGAAFASYFTFNDHLLSRNTRTGWCVTGTRVGAKVAAPPPPPPADDTVVSRPDGSMTSLVAAAQAVAAGEKKKLVPYASVPALLGRAPAVLSPRPVALPPSPPPAPPRPVAVTTAPPPLPPIATLGLPVASPHPPMPSNMTEAMVAAMDPFSLLRLHRAVLDRLRPHLAYLRGSLHDVESCLKGDLRSPLNPHVLGHFPGSN